MFPQRIAAMIASAITALNIGLSALTMPAGHFATEQVIDPLHLYNDQYHDVIYQEWLDKSEIKIDRETVIIDGVSYDDVWLSNNAAEKFRTAGLDFKSAYNIASNTEATYAEGIGYVNYYQKQDNFDNNLHNQYLLHMLLLYY